MTPNTPTTIWIDGDRALDIMDPDGAAIDIRFIAGTLSRINRFNGRTPVPYSVAQHSLLVAGLLPARLRRYGMLHDAHEAILGDTTSPLKAALRQMTGTDALSRLERAWDAMIHQVLGLPWPLTGDDAALIHAADRRALATEMRDLLDIAPARLPCQPDRHILTPWPWPKAEERFLTEWQRLTDAATCRPAAE